MSEQDEQEDGVPPVTTHIFGGGTVFHVRPHLALCAPAYGQVARDIHMALLRRGVLSKCHMTKMAAAGGGDLETNEDVALRIDELVEDPSTKMIFMAAALCDFEGAIVDEFADPSYVTRSGKDQLRLHTSLRNVHTGEDVPHSYNMKLTPSAKVIRRVRKTRKDIFLVGFKTTSGSAPPFQYEAGLTLLKQASCNLVLANDVHTRLNMVITPEQARYHETTDRAAAINGLVDMAVLRSQLHFTRSKIVPGEPVPWTSELVPSALREVVNHCIERGAYRPFLDGTVGHFAVKLDERSFLTSRRKTNYNRDLFRAGLVLVEADGPDEVIAHGSRPSVGGQSQRIVFAEHPDTDCIVHFHCRPKPTSVVPVRSQREYECGSHECGQNTSSGLERFALPKGQHLYAVTLDQHGPNIVFHRAVNPKSVIEFIEANYQLGTPTDAYL